MRSLGQPVGSLAADLIGVSMITCKNDRLLELLWFVGYCIEFPTQLAVRIGGGAEWNRRVMYRAIREGYVRLYRKKHKRHVIRSMSLTQKGFEYVAQRDPEALSMIYSRVNSSERIYPGWIDKILRLHAIAIGTVMSNAAGASFLISQKPSLMSPAKRATNAVVPDPNKIYWSPCQDHEARKHRESWLIGIWYRFCCRREGVARPETAKSGGGLLFAPMLRRSPRSRPCRPRPAWRSPVPHAV